MSTSKFPLALGMSFLAHLSVFLSLSALSIMPKQKILKEIEVNYLKIKSGSVPAAKKMPKDIVSADELDKIIPGQRLILSTKNKIPENRRASYEIDQNKLFLNSKNALQKPRIPKTEFLTPSRVKLSAVEMESSGKLPQAPAYLTYSNFLRERIRHSLYNKFSYIKDKGLVCLKFALDANGSLIEYHIILDKTNASDKLKQIAIVGLQDASPFPPLPKELNSPAATFSVLIHFIEQESD